MATVKSKSSGKSKTSHSNKSWWDKLSHMAQLNYIKEHPNSKYATKAKGITSKQINKPLDPKKEVNEWLDWSKGKARTPGGRLKHLSKMLGEIHNDLAIHKKELIKIRNNLGARNQRAQNLNRIRESQVDIKAIKKAIKSLEK